jgi:2-phospho-L-lactate guanylyltransferase
VILAAVPIKPFGVAKERLSPVIGADERSTLGRAVAARTVGLVAEAGAEAAVVTADAGVINWAKALGLGVIREEAGVFSGLDGAAATVARRAAGMGVPWALVHADLPLAAAADFSAVFEIAVERPVIAPSYDGGTNVLTGTGADFPFSFGPGSFQRHLAHIPHAQVVCRAGLAMDLDTPRDLEMALSSPEGRWLGEHLQPTDRRQRTSEAEHTGNLWGWPTLR